MPAGWSGGRSGWWVGDAGEQLGPRGLPGPVLREVQGQASGRGRDPAGYWISLRRMVAVVARARSEARVAGEGGGGAGEVERDHRQHQPGGVGGELPGRQVRQGGVLQVGVDLFDDRVPAVGLVRGHGVEDGGVGGGEERVEPPDVEQACPARRRGAARRGSPGSGARSAGPAPARPSLGGERGEADLGDLGAGDPAAGGLVEDGVGVLDRGPRILADAGDRGLDRAGPSGR